MAVKSVLEVSETTSSSQGFEEGGCRTFNVRKASGLKCRPRYGMKTRKYGNPLATGIHLSPTALLRGLDEK